MVVVLPNTTLRARRKTHAFERDARGKSFAKETFEPETAAYPGAVTSAETGPDAALPWTVRADMALWPLHEGDMLVTADGREFIVQWARPVQIPGCDAVDHVQARASLAPPWTA